MSTALSSLSLYQDLPPPAHGKAVEGGLSQWRGAADEAPAPIAAQMRALVSDPAGNRLLASIFGNSPYLTQSCLREPAFLVRLVEHGHDATFAELMHRLNRELDPGMPRPELMTALRIEKRRAALLIALADLAGLWPLAQVTAALSRLAESSLRVVARHLMAGAKAAGDIAASDIDASGFIILALGKLGAHELNYSSDIDLILLFDAERARYTGRHSAQALFTNLAHELVRMMAERTGDGYVFRTDLRLRPDPGATPPAVALRAALSYYESAGQNWERAAFIKAWPVAGDREAGAAFLAELRPFLWRKHLDFAAIQDIHSIKRQINAHRGGARIAVEGHDIKLGRGGIREIEFFAQTQQLIWGGRQPELRHAGTLEALNALASSGHVTAAACEQMTEAYHFLRKLEHRLQMIDDAQTHRVPNEPAALHRVAVLMGFASASDFAQALTQQLAMVENIYMRLFEEAPSLAGPGNLVFTGAEDDPETLKTITGLGFADASTVSSIIRAWHHGRYRATRSQRARELLTELVPALLAAFGASPNPDTAFIRFDSFLARLPAGVGIFSLFYNNPPILSLVAEIMGAGTRLADAVARRPILLDAVISENFFEAPPLRAVLAGELNTALDGAAHYEEMLDLARRWVGERKFKISVQLLRHWLNGENSGAAFADVAETAIDCLLPRVIAEFERSHGKVPGGEMIVVALGKLGSREVTVTSDLDLILVYDAPEGVEASDGARPLPVATYYARVSQRFINALTALTSEGALYEVDTRLRPSGTSGPAASSFAAFRRYHQELAWTWEQMALTRARVVAGPPRLAGAVRAEIQWILTRKRSARHIVIEVADMRQRIADEHRASNFWDVKHRPGGMIDIEFIVQYLQLCEAAQHTEVLKTNTIAALQALEGVGALTAEAAQELIQALTLWRNVQGLLKLTAEEPFDDEKASPALKAILAAGAGSVDFAAIKEDMEAAALRARARFDAIVAAQAAEARKTQAAPPQQTEVKSP
jgi:[glutamine synthetase] adenylyltransferase / [glutamine synthetase]-adenylyl-L-tyrosine phosphorylase